MADDPKGKLTAPAVFLIILAIINTLSAFLWLLGFLNQYLGNGQQHVVQDGAERLGYYIGATLPFAIGVTSIVVAPFILFGAIRMIGAKNYSIAKMAAVLALLPFTSFCCLLGLPIGLWALIVLNKPEVKNAFLS
jgi:hypothetical protein